MGYLFTYRAQVARLWGRPFFAVQGLGEYPGRSGLADAPGAREYLGVSYPVLGYGVLQCGCDMRLAYYIVKSLGPILSCEDNVTHGRYKIS